ncbi:MAG: NUDIX hydrolase [Thermomicrobiales bacterium]|nr:NUDIX hydrolase [Thermomicrobiales bacterium]
MEPVFCQRCGAATELRAIDGRDRPVCLGCGAVTYLDPKLAAAVLIERQGKLLLGRRGPGAREAGRWSFPAGFVERGEEVEAAARREVREEVRLDVRLGPLLALLSSEGETVVLAVYSARDFRGEPIAADDLVDVGWFAPDDLPELAFPHDRRIIEAWKALRAGVI